MDTWSYSNETEQGRMGGNRSRWVCLCMNYSLKQGIRWGWIRMSEWHWTNSETREIENSPAYVPGIVKADQLDSMGEILGSPSLVTFYLLEMEGTPSHRSPILPICSIEYVLRWRWSGKSGRPQLFNVPTWYMLLKSIPHADRTCNLWCTYSVYCT